MEEAVRSSSRNRSDARVKARKRCFFAVVFVAVLLVAASYFRRETRSGAGFLGLIPIGSDVGLLHRNFREKELRSGSVIPWTSPQQIAPTEGEVALGIGSPIQTKWGAFKRGRTLEFASELPGGIEYSRFTGEITLFADEPLMSGVAYTFVYVDGKLMQKDWGHLPG